MKLTKILRKAKKLILKQLLYFSSHPFRLTPVGSAIWKIDVRFYVWHQFFSPPKPNSGFGLIVVKVLDAVTTLSHDLFHSKCKQCFD